VNSGDPGRGELTWSLTLPVRFLKCARFHAGD